jgi:MFS family permease
MGSSPGSGTPGETEKPKQEPIWTSRFVLICAALFSGAITTGMLAPVVPLYVTHLGYSEAVVGLVVAAFSVMAFVLRPFLGYLADTRSVRGVLASGAVLVALAAAALPSPWIWLVAAANGLRGLGWSGVNTGTNTLLAHTAPPTRRGEAAGYMSTFLDSTLAFTPMLALWLLSTAPGLEGFQRVFWLGAFTAAVAALITWRMPSQMEPVRSAAPVGPPSLSQFYDRGVFFASMLLFTLALVIPTSTAFIPLYARSIGIPAENTGPYYLAVGVMSLVGRLLLGRLSDRFGRGTVLLVAFGSVVAALTLFSQARDLPTFMVAGVLFSLGQGLHGPASLALAIDSADPSRRGRAMASYTLWWQIGTGVGATAIGWLVTTAGYQATYLLAVIPPLVGSALVVARWRHLRPA